MDKVYLLDLVVDESIGIKEAQKLARHLLERKRAPAVRVEEGAFRFRNIPICKFKKESLKTKEIHEGVKIIVGHLAEEA